MRRSASVLALASALFAMISASVSSQSTKPAAAAPPAPTAAPAASATAAPAAKPFKEEELASLVAPIALYPDQVIAQILMASTYPLEVVEAYRWVQANSKLKGEALATEAKKQSWDASVQGLTALPDVLKMMDEKLDWTQKLGDAVLAQQADVLAMVQTLRKKAKDSGNLKSDEHQTVKTEPAPAPAAGATTSTTAAATTTTIVIEPTNPEVVYVPTYSPTVVYGAWMYPAYPPYYYYPPYYNPAAGFWWGVGVGISIGVWGSVWNNNCNWGGGDITINRGDINIDRGDRNTINNGDRGNRGDRGNGGASNKGSSWQHNPDHRKGVDYRDSGTAKKYNSPQTNRASTSDAYRGRSDAGASAGTRDLGGGGAGTRNQGGASAGTRDVGGGSSGTRDLGGASAGTRDVGGGSSSRAGTSSSRSTSSSMSSSRSSGGSAFGGTSSGSRASSYGSRGGMSRGGGGGGRRR